MAKNRTFIEPEIEGLMYMEPGSNAPVNRVILHEQDSRHPNGYITMNYHSEPTLVYVTEGVRDKWAQGKLRPATAPEPLVPDVVVREPSIPEPTDNPILDPDTGEYVDPEQVEGEPVRRRGRRGNV